MGVSPFRRMVWSESITVYHRTLSADAVGKTVTTWTRFEVSGCFYGWKRKRRIAGVEIVPEDSRVVRIPAENVPAGFSLGKGDVIVRGIAAEVLAENASPLPLIKRYGEAAFLVNRFIDNTKLTRTAHYFASEELHDTS